MVGTDMIRRYDELRASGISDEQALAAISTLETMISAVSDKMATKEELSRVREDIARLEKSFDEKLNLFGSMFDEKLNLFGSMFSEKLNSLESSLKSNIKSEVKSAISSMTIKVNVMIAVSVIGYFASIFLKQYFA